MGERTKYINFRATPEEIRRIRARMEEAGVKNLSAYLIHMAMHGYIIALDLKDLKEILRLMQISGNNLNQYARRANETGSIYLEDIEELRQNQRKMLEELGKVLDQLSTL